jgi:hypothetical protein
MIKRQLELSFGKARGCQPMDRRQRHLNRANWWFERMRHVVNRAFDWQPAPLLRPEQIWFAGAVPAGPAASSQDERQICE